MFNITQYGNVVNIDSPNVEFDITITQISGTSFQIANIEAIGYDWEVTSSGTMMMANVKLIPGLRISGPCFGQSNYRKMLYAPWDTGQTMGTVGTTGSLTPTLLYSADVALGYYAPRMQITNKYVFLYVDPVDGIHIKRYSIDDFSEQDYYADAGNNYTWDCAVYNNSTVFTLEENWDTDDVMRICKVSYPTGTSYSTGTTTTEVMCEWDYYSTVDGIEYNGWDNYFFGRVKNGTYDCIVNIMSFIGDISPTQYLWKVVIYNINTNTINEQWVDPSNEWDADLYNVPYGSTSPAFYGSKIIFTYALIDLTNLPGPPYGSICLIPTMIIDISNNSVTLIDDIKWDLDADYTYVNTYHATSVINYTTGIYYFTAWVDPAVGSGAYYIFSMDINSPSVVMGDACSTYLECHQGENQGYAIDEINLPGNNNVVTIPSETVVANVDTLLDNFGRVESLAAIDIPNDMIWNIKSSVLQGKTLGAGSNRDITVDWAGATIPFTYPANREVWVRILDSRSLVMVYSSSAPSYQQDFYILKET